MTHVFWYLNWVLAYLRHIIFTPRLSTFLCRSWWWWNWMDRFMNFLQKSHSRLIEFVTVAYSERCLQRYCTKSSLSRTIHVRHSTVWLLLFLFQKPWDFLAKVSSAAPPAPLWRISPTRSACTTSVNVECTDPLIISTSWWFYWIVTGQTTKNISVTFSVHSSFRAGRGLL